MLDEVTKSEQELLDTVADVAEGLDGMKLNGLPAEGVNGTRRMTNGEHAALYKNVPI